MRARVGRIAGRARACALATAIVTVTATAAIAEDRLPPAEGAAWDLERAFVEMERLQAEVAVLKGIARAQAALLAWNRERAETLGPDSGAGPAVLSARLCAEPGLEIWCRLLPATFGRDAANAADHGQGKDGER